MKKSEIIRGGIEILHKDGWHQGSATGSDGSRCGMMAVEISNPDKYYVSNFDLFTEMSKDIPKPFERFSKFNDLPTTTFEDVVISMERTASRLEAQGE